MSEQTNDRDDFGDALAYKANVPLTWSESGDASLTSFSIENEQCLQLILNLSEHHSSEHSEELTAISALERKVDLTLQMVSELLRATIEIPSSKAVRLGAHEISWNELSALPALNTQLDISIYLHDLYPKPLRLRGHVKSVVGQECIVELEPQADEFQQLLEKFIFLHHRRAIANSKKT